MYLDTTYVYRYLMYLPMCTSRRYEQHQSTLHVGSRLYYLNSTYQRKPTKTSPRSLIHPSSRRYCTRRLQVPKVQVCIPHSKVPVQLPVVQQTLLVEKQERKKNMFMCVEFCFLLIRLCTCSSCVVQGRTTWKTGGFFSCLWPLFEL